MILYDCKIGLTYKENHACLLQTCTDQALSDSTVLDCPREFYRSNLNIEADGGLGSPSAVFNKETIDGV
jgi:hypothetical protein